MTSDVMLDSSILIEYVKERKIELFDKLLATPSLILYINSTVLSEYIFHWIATKGEKSPKSLQQAKQIGRLLRAKEPLNFLKLFTVLSSDDRIVAVYLDLMEKYNLLPNDALIIATAKLHQITTIASYDADFEPACAGEGIRLIRNVTDLV